MNITATDKPVEDQLVDFVVVPYFENTKQLTGSAKNIDDLLKNKNWIKYHQLLIVEQIYHYWLLDGIKKML